MPQNPINQEMSRYYRRRLKELGNPPLGELGRAALRHWRMHLPKLTAELEASGILTEAAIVAQEGAKESIQIAVDQGSDKRAAEEEILPDVIYLPAESEYEDQAEVRELEEEQAEEIMMQAFDRYVKYLELEVGSQQPTTSPSPTPTSPPAG